jgi:hypothetical protein
MLRLVLLVLYLIASSANPEGSGWDPLGLNPPPPPPPRDAAGSGWDPLG